MVMMGAMSSFKWEDPPVVTPRGRPAHPWAEWAAKLRTRPGQWARLYEYPTKAKNTSSGLGAQFSSNPASAAMPKAEFARKAVRRGNKIALYARYIGQTVGQPDDSPEA